MIINKSFNLKLATVSISLLTLVSCNPATTKPETHKSISKIQTKKIVSTTNFNPAKSAQKKPIQQIQKKISAPTPSNVIPAWRRAAGHTMTRGSKDAIFPAAKDGNLTLLKELLAEGTAVDHRNFNGETVLHVAASRGNLIMVKYLVGKGANINAITGKQWQPIHHAMRFEHSSVANYLISKKASLLTKTSDGLTALELSKSSKKSGIQHIIKKYTP